VNTSINHTVALVSFTYSQHSLTQHNRRASRDLDPVAAPATTHIETALGSEESPITRHTRGTRLASSAPPPGDRPTHFSLSSLSPALSRLRCQLIGSRCYLTLHWQLLRRLSFKILHEVRLKCKVKVKFSYTRYRALGPERIPVYRQSARR